MLKLIACFFRLLKFRVNLTLNRDKEDAEDSQDEIPDSPEPRKSLSQPTTKAPVKLKTLTTRSRSVLGCDQVGVETLVSLLSSGGSDSEKDEKEVQQQILDVEVPKPKNILRKTGKLGEKCPFFFN